MKILLVKTFRRILSVEYTFQSMVLLGLRVAVGWQFFLTGRGKLAHLPQTTAYFADLGIPLPGLQASTVGGMELAGGLMLVAGLGTRLAALPLAFTMLVAYATAHRPEAFASMEDFIAATPFPFLAATLVLAAFGGGRWSFDTLAARFIPRVTKLLPDVTHYPHKSL